MAGHAVAWLRAGRGSIPLYDLPIDQKRFSRREFPTITGSPPRTDSALPEIDWDWRRVRTRCLKEARRVLRDREDAEEAVQEAMARAWRRRDACASPDDPMGWLLRITHNEALRVLESRKLRSQREVATPLDLAEEDGEEPIDELIQALATRQALDFLRPEDQVLIHLRYRHDLSQADVARRLGLPEGTVKVRLHRIRARLRNAWTPDN